MLRKILILAAIIMIITTIKTENAFDLNSGRMRLKVGVLGFTVYNQIKETPLSQLKAQFFPTAVTEPNWCTLNSKSLLNRTERVFPVGGMLKIALMLNNNTFSSKQKTAIIKEVWTRIKTQDYQAINSLQQKLEKQNAAAAVSPTN
jgi:hypothetical protein